MQTESAGRHVALVGYIDPLTLIVVTVPTSDCVTDKGIQLSEANVYVGRGGDLLQSEAFTYTSGVTEEGYSPAWHTAWQRVTASVGGELVHEYVAMRAQNSTYTWREQGLTAEIRPLNPEHFEINESAGLCIVSKPRHIVYAGERKGLTAAVTMIGNDRSSAEFYLAEDSKTAQRKMVAMVVPDDKDPLAYGLHVDAELFTYYEASAARVNFRKLMREAGASRRETKDVLGRLHEQGIPDEGYYGNFRGGLTTIPNLDDFILDQNHGCIIAG